MAANQDGMMPATATMPTDGQRVFLRFYTGVLIDLVVLNLLAEYWDQVFVSSFSVSLLAAVVLQALLKLTIACEHWVANYWNGRGPGGLNKFMRFFCAWLVLFGSKFVILEALVQVFGKNVHFGGPYKGVVVLIGVVVAMLLAEEVMLRVFRRIR